MRTEKDIIGTIDIPGERYWGIHTARAIANFNFEGGRFPLDVIYALAKVKKACTIANVENKYLDRKIADAIVEACNDIITGKLDEEFPLANIQGGAGTSVNMNVNEVITNKALELLGKPKGSYDIIDPIETVNLHQSTNDTFPTAVRIAVIEKLRVLSASIAKLQGAFQKKEKEFSNVIMLSRTEMQNAVPITMGIVFASFAEALARDRWRIFKSEERIRTVNIGGTAIGTGLTAPRSYIFSVIEKLREITSLPLARADLLCDQTANADAFVEVSGMVVANATNIIKISNDLRFMHYQNEIEFLPVQAGSSIMPTKINPVIMEAVISASIKVKSLDSVVKEAVSYGSMQINEFMPLIADSILQEIEILTASNNILTEHVLAIKANENVCKEHIENSFSYITPFVPHLGYKQCEQLVEEFKNQKKNKNLKEYLTSKLGKNLVDRVLSPESLTALGYKK